MLAVAFVVVVVADAVVDAEVEVNGKTFSTVVDVCSCSEATIVSEWSFAFCVFSGLFLEYQF